MSNNFKSDFDEYLSSRIQTGLDEHAKSNPSYKRMREIYENYYELADEIAEELPHDDRETMLRYFDTDSTVKTEEGIAVYNQGMKDCVGILQYLGVL